MKINGEDLIGKPNALTRAVICILGFSILPNVALGFSFPGVDFVDINTGFDTGFAIPGKDDAPRWDAVDFMLGTGNIFNGRSLAGGITYNFEAGFLNKFTWAGVAPTQAQLDAAIAAAFSVWDVNSPLSFLKVNTATVLTNRNAAGNDILGADIDLFATDISPLAETAVYGIRQADGGNVTLTSGPADYPSSTIAAVDIRIDLTGSSGNPWTLPIWTKVLTHEIGHAIGLGDVESNPFWDTNDTLNDVMTISALDPNNSQNLANKGELGAAKFSAIDILMESGLGTTPYWNARPNTLANDDIAGRFFLYPVPEPESYMMMLAGLGLLGFAARRRKQKAA
jgi:hypothetical protein